MRISWKKRVLAGAMSALVFFTNSLYLPAEELLSQGAIADVTFDDVSEESSVLASDVDESLVVDDLPADEQIRQDMPEDEILYGEEPDDFSGDELADDLDLFEELTEEPMEDLLVPWTDEEFWDETEAETVPLTDVPEEETESMTEEELESLTEGTEEPFTESGRDVSDTLGADETFTDGDFVYKVNWGEAIITGYTGNASSVVIPSTVGDNIKVYKIASNAFTQNDTMLSAVIPVSVDTIEKNAFYDLSSFRQIVFEGSITIQNAIIGECPVFEEVYLGKDVKKYNEYWNGRLGVRYYTVDPENPAFSTDDEGVLYNKDKTELVSYPMNKADTVVELPEGVSIKESGAGFSGNTFVEKVTIDSVPDHTYMYLDSVFRGCSNLREVYVNHIAGQVYVYTTESPMLENVYLAGDGSGKVGLTGRSTRHDLQLLDISAGISRVEGNVYDYNSYDCASSVYSADEDCVYSFDTNQKVLLKTDLSQSQPVCTTVLRLTSTGSICAGYVNLTDGYLYVFYSVFNQTDRKTYISRMETYRITDDPDNPVRVKSVDILDVSLLKCSAGAYSGSQQYQGLSLQPHPEGTLITDTYNKVAYLISYEGVVRRIYNLESDSQYPAEIMYYNQDADIYYFLDRLRGKIYYRSD